MNLAVAFVLMLNGEPVEHFDDAFECNQAAIELVNKVHPFDRVGCHGFDANGVEIVTRGDKEIRYIRPVGHPVIRYELKVIK